jgi:uncharacterized protein (TIGR02300 family)
VTKPELGTKRFCSGCSAKFYDLGRTPIVCPTCATVFIPPKPPPERRRAGIETPIMRPKVEAPIAPMAEAENEQAVSEAEADAGVPLLEDMDDEEDAGHQSTG